MDYDDADQPLVARVRRLYSCALPRHRYRDPRCCWSQPQLTLPNGVSAGRIKVLTAKRLDGDTSRMEVDDEDGDEVIPGETLDGSAAIANELLAALRFAMQLTFVMLSHTLCHPLRRPSQYATQTLNPYNTIMLTFLATVVDAFAHEWGLIPTASTVLHTIPEVKAFTEQVAQAGQWNGEAVEGFVVRTHVSTTPTAKNGKSAPYPAGSSFFFNVKFDELYLMYRNWREVTKTLLSKGPSASNMPKGKLRRAETQAYVRWVCAEIQRDCEQFDGFTKGKGIIVTHERFLAWMASAEGKDTLAEGGGANVGEEVSAGGGAKEEVDWTRSKVIIVPVAIPGVGEYLSLRAGDVCRHRAMRA